MSFLQVNHLIDWMYRGTDYTLQLEIKEDCSVDPMNLTGASVVLVLSDTNITEEVTFQKTGNIVDAGLGKVEFEFEPADTAEMMAKAYALSVYVTLNNKVTQVVQGQFGIISSTLATGGE